MPVGPQPAGDLQAVEVGEHHVEDDEVGRVLLGRRQGQAAVDRLVDVEALVAERGGDGVDDRGLVVDHQDALAAGGFHRSLPLVLSACRRRRCGCLVAPSIAPGLGRRV